MHNDSWTSYRNGVCRDCCRRKMRTTAVASDVEDILRYVKSNHFTKVHLDILFFMKCKFEPACERLHLSIAVQCVCALKAIGDCQSIYRNCFLATGRCVQTGSHCLIGLYFANARQLTCSTRNDFVCVCKWVCEKGNVSIVFFLLSSSSRSGLNRFVVSFMVTIKMIVRPLGAYGLSYSLRCTRYFVRKWRRQDYKREI